MFDRYQVRYFLAVVDHGNFTRAAAACNVSQPTLSVGISKLESALGGKLFRRNSQRVQLTHLGTRFLTHARKIESEFNLALKVLSERADIPMIRIGILRSVPGHWLAAIVSRLQHLDPLAMHRIELVEGSERELLGHLSRDRIDVALTLVERGGDRFHEETLFSESYGLVLPASHPLAGEEVISAEAVGDEVMILRPHCEALSETSRHFTERGVRPHFALRTTNDERALELVAAGLGVTVMPDSFARPGVARARLGGFALRRTIGLAYTASAEGLAANPPPAIAAIRQALATAADGGGQP